MTLPIEDCSLGRSTPLRATEDHLRTTHQCEHNSIDFLPARKVSERGPSISIAPHRTLSASAGSSGSSDPATNSAAVSTSLVKKATCILSSRWTLSSGKEFVSSLVIFSIRSHTVTRERTRSLRWGRGRGGDSRKRILHLLSIFYTNPS